MQPTGVTDHTVRRAVVAIGGNALMRRGEPLDAEWQERNVATAAASIAAIARSSPDLELIVTHGNGPQIGILALQALADRLLPLWPLHLLGAETGGMIGFLLEQAISAACPEREVATLLTRTIVDPDDPAFATPTKPIGPMYDDRAEAERLAQHYGWTLQADGDGWRRVVASPEPIELTGMRSVTALTSRGTLVICGGGGGIPVARRSDGALRGIDAVVDKDFASALLADRIDADVLLLMTDVPGVYEGWRTPEQREIATLSVEEARRRDYVAGSIGPKIEAGCRFAAGKAGRRAVIGSLRDGPALLDGTAGTHIALAADTTYRSQPPSPS